MTRVGSDFRTNYITFRRGWACFSWRTMHYGIYYQLIGKREGQLELLCDEWRRIRTGLRRFEAICDELWRVGVNSKQWGEWFVREEICYDISESEWRQVLRVVIKFLESLKRKWVALERVERHYGFSWVSREGIFDDVETVLWWLELISGRKREVWDILWCHKMSEKRYYDEWGTFCDDSYPFNLISDNLWWPEAYGDVWRRNRATGGEREKFRDDLGTCCVEFVTKQDDWQYFVEVLEWNSDDWRRLGAVLRRFGLMCVGVLAKGGDLRRCVVLQGDSGQFETSWRRVLTIWVKSGSI